MSFPQAVGGALWANPDVYPQVPLRVRAPEADAVTVFFDNEPIDASPLDDGVWLAELDVTGLAPTRHTVRATAGGDEADVELELGTEGMQLTDWLEVGRAGTPQLHATDGHLFVSWTDRRATDSEVWLAEIDGAGRWLSEPVALIKSDNETLYARAVLGKSKIFVLYQDLEGSAPYVSYLKVVDLDGQTLLGPIALQPEGTYGAWGGAVDLRDGAFVATWRTSLGSGTGDVRWIRIDEQTLEVTGPLSIASSGDDDPHGTFPIYAPLRIALDDNGDSRVGFVREEWNGSLAMAIPKAQVAHVGSDGTVLDTAVAGGATAFTWHHELRTSPSGDLLWVDTDLTSSEDNPPYRFWLAPSSAPSSGTLLLDAPGERGEPWLTQHPEHDAVAAWLDARSYEVDPDTGRIELYAGRIDDGALSDVKVFEHARFVMGTSELSGRNLGTNTLLIWLDERHGNGIADPKPEVFMETLWN